MTVNEGILDRIIRLILALVITILFFMGALPGYWALLLIVSGALLVTVVTGYCHLYKLLGTGYSILAPPQLLVVFSWNFASSAASSHRIFITA